MDLKLLNKLKEEIKFNQKIIIEDGVVFALSFGFLSVIVLILTLLNIINFDFFIHSIGIFALIIAPISFKIEEWYKNNVKQESAIDFMLRIKELLTREEYNELYDFIYKYDCFDDEIGVVFKMFDKNGFLKKDEDLLDFMNKRTEKRRFVKYAETKSKKEKTIKKKMLASIMRDGKTDKNNINKSFLNIKEN